MGWKACHHDHSNSARYALCSSIRYNIKQTYGLDFPPGTSRHVEIPPFYGEESEHEAHNWIGVFEEWAVQENLNSKKKIQLVLLGLFGDAYEWARQLNLDKAKWKEFVCLFREKYAGDPTPWSGSPKFPYWLYFSGTARPTAGQVQGRAGVGIVIVSPLKELQIAHVHQYLGRFCSIHVAEYTALIMGMETALQRGVRNLTVMCDSELVFNQVTGKWTACHSSIRDLKLRVRELLNEFQTCGALYISPKCNTEAQFLAKKAIDSSSDSTSIARLASSVYHWLIDLGSVYICEGRPRHFNHRVGDLPGEAFVLLLFKSCPYDHGLTMDDEVTRMLSWRNLFVGGLPFDHVVERCKHRRDTKWSNEQDP